MAVGIRSLVIGVVDTPPTDDFADVTIKAVEAGTDDQVQLVRATRSSRVRHRGRQAVRALGYQVIGVEPEDQPRPWDVLLMVAEGNKDWRELAHPATVDVFDRYHLDGTSGSV